MHASKRFMGDFILPHPPINFRHKHLSLQKQRKDKEIKKEREELQKKRKEYEESKGKWIKQELEFKLYSVKRREENMSLLMQEEKLKADLFRLAIRRDQIQSRTNPQISIEKAQLIKKYLRCVPYTAGKRMESIKFWRSQSRYNQLKFLLELAVDRFFGRSEGQKRIISNLSRIVLCKKIQFEGQWIMMCIKEPEDSSSNYCEKTSKKSHRSIYHPENANSNKEFQLTVYAITGKYFSIRKTYNEQQLREWAHNTNQNVILKPVIYSQRLSVADNLAKINALKELSENSMITPEVFRDSTRKDSVNSVQDGFKPISQQAVPSSQNSQRNDEQQECTTNQIENKSSKSNNEQSQSSKNATDENLSDNNQSENQAQNNIKLKTRKSVHSKSSFYIKGKNQTFICKFNRQFLSGIQQILFPQHGPIINLIVLKDKQQVFLLQEYIQLQNKKQILDKAVARFRLKMKIKAEQKKCLYYKIITVTSCYETIMAQEQAISLPCLFVVKSHETPQANELIISCDSLMIHHKIQNGLQIKALLHQTLKEKEDSKQLKNLGRASNMKNAKNANLRRSRQSKRKQNLRNPSRNLSIEQHQKSVLGNAKKIVEPSWVAFSKQIIDKFTHFMSANMISIQKRQFISRQWVTNRIFSIIRIQNKIRSTISMRKFNKAKEVTRIKCKWRPNSKILVTAMLNTEDKIVKVYFEIVEIGNMELVRIVDYAEQNWEAICLSLASTPEQGTFKQVADYLITKINQNIEIQTQKRLKLQAQKPQKYKRMISNFFFMISLRNRVRKNIFFIKKLIIRQRMFVLLIRRDRHVKSLLQCHLYDVLLQKTKEEIKQTKNSETAFSKQEKELGSEYGSHKPPSRSKPELDDKIYKYQKIYLMEQYFQSIDHKRIIDEFYIQKGVFLLKPPRTVNLYYIDRLNALDLNSQEFSKEYGVYERENILRINQDRISLNVSNKSLKRLIHQNISDKTEKNQTQSRQLLNNISKMKGRKQSKQNSKKEKKTSIQKNERELITFLKSNFMKENAHNMQILSKKSFGQSNSGKSGRQLYQIKDNSHQSIVYYSLYKSENVFFYLELFIVKRTFHESFYHQQLVSIEKYRLYKKQLEQATSSLFYKKLASWAHQNQDQFIKGQETSKQKNEDSFKKDETISNFVTLEFFNALIGGNKRFSFEIHNNSSSEKGPRTNTLTL